MDNGRHALYCKNSAGLVVVVSRERLSVSVKKNRVGNTRDYALVSRGKPDTISNVATDLPRILEEID